METATNAHRTLHPRKCILISACRAGETSGPPPTRCKDWPHTVKPDTYDTFHLEEHKDDCPHLGGTMQNTDTMTVTTAAFAHALALPSVPFIQRRLGRTMQCRGEL
ncbi:hypothetical protein ZHAS_00019646 [Anopheles sinensis]|uniref:Uncharacterized protein n=1 Tax=Anopheles sinensis TaxID=74873 RepID=A0A084WMY2_ANOSI|nr:hypothetical protein ZHAS_00019646 [Anopheles sinensis]